MAEIHCTSFIKAPVERVFDLCRSMEMLKVYLRDQGAQLLAGKVNGLLAPNDVFTLKGKHYKRDRFFRLKIKEVNPHTHLASEIVAGDLKYFDHGIFFKQAENGTIIIDKINFKSKFGIVSNLIDQYYIKPKFEKMIAGRNDLISKYAESGKWKFVIEH